MRTAHEIINSFVADNAIDMKDFLEWFDDCRFPQEEANVYDSRYLGHLRSYVEQRDASLI